MKYVLSIIGMMLVSTGVFAQFKNSEYRFFSLRLSANNNFLSSHPDSVSNFGITTPLGDYPLNPNLSVPSSNFSDYALGFSADIWYNIDFKSENAGVITGLTWVSNVYQTQYATDDAKYWLIEKYRMTSVGVPLLLKLGSNIYRKQGFVYFGGQFNYNLSLTRKEQGGINSVTEWDDKPYYSNIPSAERSKFNLVAVAGFNFLIFNIEADYMLGSFFNQEFERPDGIHPYLHYGKNLIGLKFGVNIPLSEWVSLNSWQAEKLRRRLKLGSDAAN